MYLLNIHYEPHITCVRVQESVLQLSRSYVDEYVKLKKRKRT